MSTLELNGKDFATQTSSAEPVLASTVTGGAGLSGSTSLGTNPTMTLGSNATFPAGHVIQVKKLLWTGQASSDSTSWNTKIGGSDDTAASNVLITPKSSASNMFLFCTGPTYSQAATGTAYLDFYKNSDNFDETYNLSGKVGVGLGQDQGDKWDMSSIMWVDERDENLDEEIQYSVAIKHSILDTSSMVLGYQSDGSYVTLIVMEVMT